MWRRAHTTNAKVPGLSSCSGDRESACCEWHFHKPGQTQYKEQSQDSAMSAVYRQAVLTEVRAAQRRSMPALATLLLRRTSLLMILTVLSTSPPARDGSSVSPTSSKMWTACSMSCDRSTPLACTKLDGVYNSRLGAEERLPYRHMVQTAATMEPTAEQYQELGLEILMAS